MTKTIVWMFAFAFIFTLSGFAQTQRPRIVAIPTSRPTEPIRTGVLQRPVLTNKIVVSTTAAAINNQPQSFIRKTGSSQPVIPISKTVNPTSFLERPTYNLSTSQRMMQAIQARVGIPYRYGSDGPNRYDCSGFVWSVFQDAGIFFERTSARSLWAMSAPVAGDEQFKFGTLVFFNGLGHIGIVADANGFYQASSSKGITYSPFEGYWAKRIVGFRRLPEKVF